MGRAFRVWNDWDISENPGIWSLVCFEVYRCWTDLPYIFFQVCLLISGKSTSHKLFLRSAKWNACHWSHFNHSIYNILSISKRAVCILQSVTKDLEESSVCINAEVRLIKCVSLCLSSTNALFFLFLKYFKQCFLWNSVEKRRCVALAILCVEVCIYILKVNVTCVINHLPVVSFVIQRNFLKSVMRENLRLF